MPSRFVPPRCPNQRCSQFRKPTPDFFTRQGWFHPLCRNQAVPRFRCRHCRRGFSRQTFRADFRDHRPDLNAKVIQLLSSGIGLRQCARLLQISRRCLELKARKIGFQLRGLNQNLKPQLEGKVIFMLDEMETFEQCRSTKPLTLPVLIEKESAFVVSARCAPIKPSGSMPEWRKQLIARREGLEGKRRHGGRWCIRRVFRDGRSMVAAGAKVEVISDEKTVYRTLAREVFGDCLSRIRQFPGKAARNVRNPLFRINLTNAMARDLNGRLRRRSWLVSKRRWFLDLQLEYFRAWRNFHRTRFNRDKKTPAEILGITKRCMTPHEMVSWRQDWGALSCRLAGLV